MMSWRFFECISIITILCGFGFCLSEVVIAPLSKDMVFFEPKDATGNNNIMSETSEFSLIPLYHYERLFDGKKGIGDINYFWATDNQMCVHVYLKQLVLLKSIVIYIHPNQLKNVKTIVGLTTDGFTVLKRTFRLSQNDKPGWIIFYPECSELSELAVMNRFRMCFILKKKNIWFGINEIEINAETNVKAEENIARFRTLQTEMEGCEAYRVVGPPQNIDDVVPTLNWKLQFEQPQVVKVVQALIAVTAGQTVKSLNKWATLQLGNSSLVIIEENNCTWSQAPESVSMLGNALFQWHKVKCQIELPPIIGIVLADNLRVRDLKVVGSSYRYPRPALSLSVSEDYEKAKLTCQLDRCREHRLLIYEEKARYLPAVVNGSVVDGVPLLPSQVNVTKTKNMLVVSMPLDYEHRGRYKCICKYEMDNTLLESNAVDVTIDPDRMPAQLVRQSVLSNYVFEYKFSWSKTEEFSNTKHSYVLIDSEDADVLATRMRVISYRKGQDNSSIEFEKGKVIQPREAKICRTSTNQFCVRGFEFVQQTQFYRLDGLKIITVPVWIGFINEWKNITIHIHKKGRFDFWVMNETGSRIVADLYCPLNEHCAGNLTQTSNPCDGPLDNRPLTNIRQGHTVLTIDNISPTASYKICFWQIVMRCMTGEGTCRKCVDIGFKKADWRQTLTNIVTLSANISGYEDFDENNNPRNATVQIQFTYDVKYITLVQCSDVVLENMDMECDDGTSRNATWRYPRLKPITIPNLPLETICFINVTLLSRNLSIVLKTSVDTNRSPFTSLVVRKWSNSTHGELQWRSDPGKFPQSYLKNYRISILAQKCNGKTSSKEIEQEKTSFTIFRAGTTSYVITVRRVVIHKKKLYFIPSRNFTFIGRPTKQVTPEIIGFGALNRSVMELSVNFFEYKRCIPVRVEVEIGKEYPPSKVLIDRDIHKIYVNTSDLASMSVYQFKVRGIFGGLTLWSNLHNYTVPFDSVILNSGNGKAISGVTELTSGSTTTYTCNCRSQCPKDVELEWNRGWIGGEKAGKGKVLTLSNLGENDSGRYVCLFRSKETGTTEPKQGIAGTLMVIVKQKAATVSKSRRNNNSGAVVSANARITCGTLLLLVIRLL